ncbi:hypothetical protein AG1IA_04519 [Rhizoctonia solani AG-1 IA]|uniref:Uncharacterized protein n=1 Tax=Thanatephorus cucumeris (strain AG1-IA) TaxID=983506 RepID=L8WXF6_THACA|nr:hypothetical protein AG1IA_04519 [Rhizoctonia solani AG-1 IA]
MQQPTAVPIKQRRNTLTKPVPGAANGALYHPQMTLPGVATSTYLTNPPNVPPTSVAHMAGISQPPAATSQRPYLAAEMGMMQEALKKFSDFSFEDCGNYSLYGYGSASVSGFL